MNQISKKQKIIYKMHKNKFSKPVERKITKPKPSFINVSMKVHFRSSLS